MDITLDYYKNEFMKFRMEVMGSTEFTPEQKLNAFGGLITVYANVKIENADDKELLESSMQALKIELDMRLQFELFGSL